MHFRAVPRDGDGDELLLVDERCEDSWCVLGGGGGGGGGGATLRFASAAFREDVLRPAEPAPLEVRVLLQQQGKTEKMRSLVVLARADTGAVLCRAAGPEGLGLGLGLGVVGVSKQASKYA